VEVAAKMLSDARLRVEPAMIERFQSGFEKILSPIALDD
jgi:hypothetical protein